MIRHAPPGPGLLSNRDQIVLQELLRAADIPEPPRAATSPGLARGNAASVTHFALPLRLILG